jgi:hypothetical protein
MSFFSLPVCKPKNLINPNAHLELTGFDKTARLPGS